jgi:hypothetical protein
MIETMALFSQGAYGEVLVIIARETIQAFVDARLHVSQSTATTWPRDRFFF